MTILKSSLNKAISRREKMLKITNAMRLVNGAGDDLDGLLIDRYHRHIQIQVLDERWHAHMDEICGQLCSAMPVDYLVVKIRRGLQMASKVFMGTNPETIVEEHGFRFKVNLDEHLNGGLFLDMRRNRWMVGQSCRNKKVLNCFSYTCAFGVYARAGGASEVINTDISRKALERGSVNYHLNGFTPDSPEFIKTDSVGYLKRTIKKGQCFDVIILDPPSFARYEKKVFQVKRDLPGLIAMAGAALNPEGRLFISTNYSELSHTDLEGMLASGVKRVQHFQRVGQDDDFPGSNSFKESYLVGLWVKFL